MKKGICFAVLVWLCLALTACGAMRLPMGGVQPSGEDKTPPPEDASPAGDKAETVSCQAEGVLFDVMSDWTQAEGTYMFFTADRNQVYGLNGVSPLGSYTPQEFFEEMAVYYQGEGEQELLEQSGLNAWISSDGVACQVGKLTGRYGSLLYLTEVVVAPQKNLAMTFAAQVREGECDPKDVWATLDALCESLTFEIGSQDYITGNTFLVGDGSQLCLQDDGSFRYYRSADDHENQYYEGEYEVWYGQAAMEQVASMTEYGLTMEELEQTLSANMNGYLPGGGSPMDYFYASGELEDDRTRYQICLDTFYAVILHNERLVYSPEEVNEGGSDVLYLGYYIPELDMADLVNANAASYTQWTWQEKTEK